MHIKCFNDVDCGPMDYRIGCLPLARKAVFLSHNQEAVDLSGVRKRHIDVVDKRRDFYTSTWDSDHTFFWESSPRIRS